MLFKHIIPCNPNNDLVKQVLSTPFHRQESEAWTSHLHMVKLTVSGGLLIATSCVWLQSS